MPGLINSFTYGAGGGGTGYVVTLDQEGIYVYSEFNGDTVSGAIVVTPTGGTGPYTYLWSRVSGSPLITIASNTTAQGLFSTTGLPYKSVLREAVWQVVVTDSLGATSIKVVPIEMQIGGGVE